jgi:HEAT repeat protein
MATAASLAAATALAADKPAVNEAAVDKAFEALKTYDFGPERKALNPIDEAVVLTQGDAAARKKLEVRLAAVLKTDARRAAKDYACRTLRVIGTAESVPTLASLLTDKDLSHMARYSLESIPAPEAAAALRDALGKVNGTLKIGMINSLGARRDAASVGAVAASLGDSDKAIACAAAHALGSIGSDEAAKALAQSAKSGPDGVKQAAGDASLMCAERLLADGKKSEAMAVYKSLLGNSQKPVKLAATRGLVVAAGKKD